jgi:hypothetical protein
MFVVNTPSGRLKMNVHYRWGKKLRYQGLDENFYKKFVPEHEPLL